MANENVTFSYGETLPSAITNGDIKVVTTNGAVFFDIGSTRIQFKDSTKLSLSGGTMSGPINMNSNKITSLATPTASTDAANKSYVDSKLITYRAGTAISISNSTISHSNIGTANTYGPGSNATLSPGSEFYVTQMTTDAQGHVSSAKNIKFTLDSSLLRTSNIVNNLTTTTAGYALDARQGRSLNNSLSTHKSSGDHDGRYYTESEMNTKLNAKANNTVVLWSGTIAGKSTSASWSLDNDTFKSITVIAFTNDSEFCSQTVYGNNSLQTLNFSVEHPSSDNSIVYTKIANYTMGNRSITLKNSLQVRTHASGIYFDSGTYAYLYRVLGNY